MSLRDEFNAYHARNPHIYGYVDYFARQAISRGYDKFAIATIWERIRWEIAIEVRDTNFKLPNNHRAYYARLWMANNPEHPHFFRIAALRSMFPVRVDRYGRETDGDDNDSPFASFDP